MPTIAENEDLELLDERATAKILDLENHETLAVWRATKRYPLPYIKIGRNVRYLKRDVLAFLESRRVHPVEAR